MLIRQRAGWRLHHQAYLWPRRPSALTTSPTLPLPRRRRSVVSSVSRGKRTAHASPSSPPRKAKRIGATIYSLLVKQSPDLGGVSQEFDSPSVSSSPSSSSSSSPGRNSAAGSCSSISSSRRSRSGSDSLDRVLEDSPLSTFLPDSGIEDSPLSTFIEDVVLEDSPLNPLETKAGSPEPQPSTVSCAGSETRAPTSCLRRRPDTRSSSESKCTEACSSTNRSSSETKCTEACSSTNNNLYSTLKGSSNHNNNHLLHLGSTVFNSLCASHHSPGAGRMGVLCTEKSCSGDKCQCGGVTASSPKPATLPSFPPSPCENSQDSIKSNGISRKRSLDISLRELDESAVTRSQRSSGTVNGIITHVISKEKLNGEITAVLGQNGFKLDNGLKQQAHLNGVKPAICLGSQSNHLPASSPQITASSSCLNGKGSTLNEAGVTPQQGSTIIVVDALKRPQPPSTLSPAQCLSPQPTANDQLHQSTQGTQGSKGSNNCSTDSNPGSPKCILSPPNTTVLSLRQRPGHSHKSSSLPASPQATPSFKSKLTTSSSLSSLSTLAAEPPSPSQPSTVQCKWRGCSAELDASDLLEHIRKHAETQIAKETYSCLWVDCKVFNKPSWSGSWLERHIVTHSGHRPFKCILDNCGQRFHSQAALERHVNGHFTANSQNGAKCSRSREEINHRMLQKRRRQMKRRSLQAVKRNDFFDEHTMAVVKQELFALTECTHLDLSGNLLHTTFQGLVVGRRETNSGAKHSLIEFTPSAVLEDEWVPEEEEDHVCEISIPLSQLPHDTVTNLHSSLYRRHRFRKHRRK